MRRLKRLGPLFLLGAVIGLVGLIISPIEGIRGHRLLVATALNSLGLPSPFVTTDSHSAFPLNRPFWSLFYEVWIANLFFAVCWRRLGWSLLGTIILISTAGLLFAEWKWHTLQSGFSWDTMEVGFARVFFSFFVGVAISRSHRRLERWVPRIPAILCLFITAALLILPLQGRTAHLYELFCLFLAFPALVLAGSWSIERRPLLGRLLGDASYAAYTIHYPPVLVLAGVVAHWQHPHRWALQAAFVALIGCIAWLAAQGDEAVRKRLGWMSSSSSQRPS